MSKKLENDGGMVSSEPTTSAVTDAPSASPRRRRYWTRFIVEIIAALVIFSGVVWYQTRHLVSSGEPVPTFELRQFDTPSAVVTNKELLGRPTLLVFWAPGCGVCAAEAKNLTDLYKSKKDDINVYAVALAYDDHAAIKGFVEKNDLQVPVLLGTDQTAADFRISSFPTAYFISPNGEVANQTIGYTTELGMRARLFFAGL